MWMNTLNDIIKYEIQTINSREEIFKKAIEEVDSKLKELTDKINEITIIVNDIVEEEKNKEKSFITLETEYIDNCKKLENILFNDINNNDTDDLIKNIQNIQKNYYNSVEDYNNNISLWNQTISENCEKYAQIANLEYPILIKNSLQKLEEFQKINLITNYKLFEVYKSNLSIFSSVQHYIKPLTYTKKEPFKYSLVNSDIINNKEYKANFYSKEVHQVLSKLKEANIQIDREYNIVEEEKKINIIENWNKIINSKPQTYIYDEYIYLKDNILQLIDDNETAEHFIKYLNFTREKTNGQLNKHVFIILVCIYLKISTIIFNESNVYKMPIMRNFIMMSQTYYATFDDIKIYIISFIKDVKFLNSNDFWKSFGLSCTLDKVNDNNNNKNTKVDSLLIFGVLIALAQTINHFNISNNNIMVIINYVIDSAKIQLSNYDDLINVIRHLNKPSNIDYTLDDLFKSLPEIINNFNNN